MENSRLLVALTPPSPLDSSLLNLSKVKVEQPESGVKIRLMEHVYIAHWDLQEHSDVCT